MRILITIILASSFMFGNFNKTIEKDTKISKEDLIQKATNGNIKAMIKLNKYYSFPETKEGLAYYKNWYKLVLKNKNTKDILNFAKVFYHYRRMFINGDEKYETLLILAKNKGSKKALFSLFEYYSYNYQENKKESIKKQIEKIATKEELETAYFRFKEKHFNGLSDELKQIMIKKAYSNAKYSLKKLQKTLSKQKLSNNYFKELLASNDLINMYEIANYFMHKTDIYKKNASMLYKKILPQINQSNIKSKIYESLAYYNLNTLKNKKEAFIYFEKGVDLKDEDCTFALLKLFQRDPKDFKKYISLKEHLLQTFEGKKIYAYHLYNRFSDSQLKSLKYFDELAEKGDKDSIVLLASQYISRPNYGFVPEAFKLSQKWQNYILDSDDSELFEKMRLKLSGYINKDGKKFEKELKKRKESSNNILILRDNFSTFRYRNPSKAINYAKKAIAYGDTQSSLSLASYYLRKRKENEAIEIYKNLSNKGDKEAIKKLKKYSKLSYYYWKYLN